MTSDPKSVAPPSESAAPEKEIANLLGRGHVENPREGEPGDAETYSEPVAPAPPAEKRIAELEAECSTRHCYASDLYALANDAIECARRWGGKDADYAVAVLLARRREADARCREGLARTASPAAQGKEK